MSGFRSNAFLESTAPVPRRSSVDEPQVSNAMASAITPSEPSHVKFMETDDEGAHEAHEHHRRGNEVAMKKVVDVLYEKVLSNPTLEPYYQGVNMEHLTHMQQKLMTFVFGGKDLLLLDNPDFNLRAIHMRSLVDEGLNQGDWEAFVKHFEETLNLLVDIPEETKASAIKWIRSTRDMFRPPSEDEIEAYKLAKAGEHGKCPFVH